MQKGAQIPPPPNNVVLVEKRDIQDGPPNYVSIIFQEKTKNNKRKGKPDWRTTPTETRKRKEEEGEEVGVVEDFQVSTRSTFPP